VAGGVVVEPALRAGLGVAGGQLLASIANTAGQFTGRCSTRRSRIALWSRRSRARALYRLLWQRRNAGSRDDSAVLPVASVDDGGVAVGEDGLD